ncbi:uncharacterized protein OCT59_029269 [Rhizophagus irregularis]|uniref:uncharacterized protein n=1 Tax=Rhizophagus irregularis TaxID=588596 RepID=UPI00331F0640|nr:hypothetical protein OCT59_029269 [Rhizophagus irregularis]
MVQKCGEQDLYNTFLQPYRYLSKGLFLIIESCIDVYTLDVLHRNNYTLYPVDYNQHQCRGQECLDVDSDNYSLGTPCVICIREALVLQFIQKKERMKFIKPKIFYEYNNYKPGFIAYDTIIIDWINPKLMCPATTYPPSGSAFGSDAENGVLKSWKLLRNEYLDSSESSETNLQEENSDESNIISLQKLQDVPCQLLDQLKDELNNYSEKELPLNEDLRNTFVEIFG